MISLKTLDNKLVKYNGKFTIKSLNSFFDEDFKKYFRKRQEDIGLELYVAVLICVRNKPIWGIASYGEQYNFIMGKRVKSLSEETFQERLEEFNEANESELATLNLYAKDIMLPQIKAYCENIKTDEPVTLDFRKTFTDFCTIMGFYSPDIVDDISCDLVYQDKQIIETKNKK